MSPAPEKRGSVEIFANKVAERRAAPSIQMSYWRSNSIENGKFTQGSQCVAKDHTVTAVSTTITVLEERISWYWAKV